MGRERALRLGERFDSVRGKRAAPSRGNASGKNSVCDVLEVDC